nr:hypothetical protein 1634Bnrm3_p114 [Cryptomonas sp.]
MHFEHMDQKCNHFHLENLKLRLENHRLKKKIKNCKCLNNLKEHNQKNIKVIEKCDFDLLRFLKTARKLNEIYGILLKNSYSCLSKLDRNNLIFKIKLMKKIILDLITYTIRSNAIIRFQINISARFFDIVFNAQIIFKQMKKLFDEILVQKFYYLLKRKTIGKILFLKEKMFSEQSEIIDLTKCKLDKMLNSRYTLKIENNTDCVFLKRILISDNLIFSHKRKFIALQKFHRFQKPNEFKFSFWVSFFINKFIYQKKKIEEVFNKSNTYGYNIKKILEEVIIQINRRRTRIYVLLRALYSFMYQIQILKKTFQNIYLVRYFLESNLTYKRQEKKILINVKDNCILFKLIKRILYIEKKSKNQIFGCKFKREKFVSNICLGKIEFDRNKLNVFQDYCILFDNSENESKYTEERMSNINQMNLERSIRTGLNICLCRVSDMNKELSTLWNMIKICNYTRKYLSSFKIGLFKYNHIDLLDKYLQMKNKFNRVVFSLKKKTFFIQKRSCAYKEIMLINRKDKHKIEEKLFEIKSMEVDFSHILNQIKK